MKKCPNCHQEVAADSIFCEHCGYDLRQTTTEAAAQPKTKAKRLGRRRKNSAAKPGKQPKSKWFKRSVWAVIGIAVIIVIVLGASFYNKQAGKDKQIANITDMISDNQSNDLAKLLVSDNTNLKITGDTVQPLLTYAGSHQDYVTNMRTDLQKNGQSADHTFTLIKSGHTMLFFPVYKLKVTTMHPTISTNVDNATITANGDALATSKNDHYSYKAGPLFPGHYTFKLSGSQSNKSVKINLISSSDTTRDVNLSVKAAKTAKDTTNDTNDDSTGATTTANDDNTSGTNTHDSDGDDQGNGRTYSDYDDLSSDGQDAVDNIYQATDYMDDIDDYDYSTTQAHDNVIQVKVYDDDDGDHMDTFRYDKANDILAVYNSDTGLFDKVTDR